MEQAEVFVAFLIFEEGYDGLVVGLDILDEIVLSRAELGEYALVALHGVDLLQVQLREHLAEVVAESALGAHETVVKLGLVAELVDGRVLVGVNAQLVVETEPQDAAESQRRAGVDLPESVHLSLLVVHVVGGGQKASPCVASGVGRGLGDIVSRLHERTLGPLVDGRAVVVVAQLGGAGLVGHVLEPALEIPSPQRLALSADGAAHVVEIGGQVGSDLLVDLDTLLARFHIAEGGGLVPDAKAVESGMAADGVDNLTDPCLVLLLADLEESAVVDAVYVGDELDPALLSSVEEGDVRRRVVGGHPGSHGDVQTAVRPYVHLVRCKLLDIVVGPH